MKLFHSIFLSVILCSPAAYAEDSSSAIEARRAASIGKVMKDFTSADGRVFKDVRITRIDDGGVSIRHSNGTARLRYGDLSPAQRERYGLDREDAIERYRLEAKVKNEYETAVAEKQKERSAKAAATYEAELQAEAKFAEARRAAILARENQILSNPIPENPTVNLATAFVPQSSVRFRNFSRFGHSGFGFSRFGNSRFGFSRFGRSNFGRSPTFSRSFSNRGFQRKASFSRSPRFNFKIR